MRKSITIYGAKSLDRYTKLILKQGFQNNSWEVVEGEINNTKHPSTDAVIYQIHGAPQATKEDKTIMVRIKELPSKLKVIVLIHRPDEVQERLVELKDILSSKSSDINVVFLGNKHINDPFYSGVKKKFIIPHGFFDVKDLIQKDPIVIGSHTTWGEMRLIKHALKLITEVFKLNHDKSRNILGYLGGKPDDQLQIDYLKQQSEHIFNKDAVEFLDVHQYSLLNSKIIPTKQHIILVDSKNVEPEDFGITFNTQMYYFENKIRTGESSGSLHTSVNIPVILEMNGSEVIEDLKTIRVPYASLNDLNSIDFVASAQEIIHTIDNESFLTMLEHNSLQARKFNNTFIAQLYVRIFEQM